MNNNKKDIKTIQETLMRDIARLDDDELIERQGQIEIARSNALAKTASTYIQSVALVLKINDAKNKHKNKINK